MYYEVIGWIGTSLVVIAYLLVSTRRIKPTSKQYQWLNLAGSIGILINAAVLHAIRSVGLNVLWLLIAAYGLLKTS